MDKLETIGAAVDAVGTSVQPVLDLWGSLCANHPNEMPALLPEDVRTIATALRDSQAELLRKMMEAVPLLLIGSVPGFIQRFASEHGIDLGVEEGEKQR